MSSYPEKLCKTCHSKYIPVSSNQKYCPSCREKKETLRLQERMLREIKGYSHINICETCGNPFGSNSGFTKWCQSCRKEKSELEAQEREHKLKEGPPLREVLCKCGKTFKTKSNYRLWCNDCAKLKKRLSRSGPVAENATTVSKTINIPMDFNEDEKFQQYLDRQNKITEKWNKKYRKAKRIEIDNNPNMFGFIYST